MLWEKTKRTMKGEELGQGWADSSFCLLLFCCSGKTCKASGSHIAVAVVGAVDSFCLGGERWRWVLGWMKVALPDEVGTGVAEGRGRQGEESNGKEREREVLPCLIVLLQLGTSCLVLLYFFS